MTTFLYFFPILICLIVGWAVMLLIMLVLSKDAEALLSKKRNFGAISVAGLILGVGFIHAIGFGPTQEISTHEYDMLGLRHDNSPETAYLSKRAFEDGYVSNLEYLQIERAADRFSERDAYRRVKSEVRQSVADMETPLIGEAK